MEQFLLSLNQSQVINILSASFGVILLSLLATFGFIFSSQFKMGLCALCILVGSLWSFASVNKTLSNYYASLDTEYSFYQSNFQFNLVKQKKVNGQVITETLSVECESSESVKVCLTKI